MLRTFASGRRKLARQTLSVVVLPGFEDRLSQLPNCFIEALGHLVQAVTYTVGVCQANDRLQRHSCREKPLDHHVVNVASDPLTVTQQSDPLEGFLPIRDVPHRRNRHHGAGKVDRAEADLNRKPRPISTLTMQLHLNAHRPPCWPVDIAFAELRVVGPGVVGNEHFDSGAS